MENVIFTSLTKEQLNSIIQTALVEVPNTFNELKNSSVEPPLTRKEAARFLKISLPTLWKWTKHGIIKSQVIAKRPYYTMSGLLEALANGSVQKYKKK